MICIFVYAWMPEPLMESSRYQLVGQSVFFHQKYETIFHQYKKLPRNLSKTPWSSLSGLCQRQPATMHCGSAGHVWYPTTFCWWNTSYSSQGWYPRYLARFLHQCCKVVFLNHREIIEKHDITIASRYTSIPHWKMKYLLNIDGWKMNFPFNMVPFQGHVNFCGVIFGLLCELATRFSGVLIWCPPEKTHHFRRKGCAEHLELNEE